MTGMEATWTMSMAVLLESVHLTIKDLFFLLCLNANDAEALKQCKEYEFLRGGRGGPNNVYTCE
jgi:hypothetical protein